MWTTDKCRDEQQAKETDRLEPKGKSPGIEVRYSSIADVAAPAERWDLSLHVLVIMRNLVSPYIFLKGNYKESEQ